MLNELALCAGIGGISLGLRSVVRVRTVCYVEREAYAAAVLAARMEDKALDEAPIWSDLASFDGQPWRGVVDLVTAGFPCQPWSVAGKQRGEQDERWAWPDIARIISECKPRGVFLENVNIKAFEQPKADLEGMGYRVPPAVCIGAKDVGAPHRRLRWFCLATDPEHWPWDQPRWRGRQDRPGAPLARDDGQGGWWAIEPDVGRVADGSPTRVDRLRAIGNSVVPDVVAKAWLTLLSSSFEG